MNNKSFIIVVGILIVVSTIGIVSYLPQRFDKALKIKVADFPKTIGEWTATDIPLTERDYALLETRNLIMRDYKNQKGDSIYLYVVYSEDNRKVAHPPEVCYMGSGATIVDKSTVQLTNSIKAVKMLVEKGDAREILAYWFKAGALNTDKYLNQQLKVVFNRMLGKRTSGAMIRVSVDVKDNNQEEALTLLKSFCTQIEPLLGKYVP
jgi:EpsI family protein